MRNIARGVLVASGLVFLYTMIFLDPVNTSWSIGFFVAMGLFIPGLLGEILFPKVLPKSMNKKALATVQEVRQTHVYVNNLPQVELILSYQTEQGQQVTTKMREVVDYVTVGAIEPGMVLPIVYNENKPQKVAIAADGETMDMLEGTPPPNMTGACIGFVRDIQQLGSEPEDSEVIFAAFTVEFTPPRQRSIVAVIKDQVTQEFLINFAVGNAIPVLYDPANPQQAVINYDPDEQVLAELQEAIAQKRIREGELDEEMYNIAKNGIHAKGMVLASSATGETKGNKTELAVRIKVTPSQGQPYEVQTNKYFDAISLKHMYSGAPVEVYYMPADPQRIAIGTPSA